MAKCPYCGGKMAPDAPEGTYWCAKCNTKFAETSSGEFRDMLYGWPRRKGRDIEPEEWRDAEDGWRPSDWK